MKIPPNRYRWYHYKDLPDKTRDTLIQLTNVYDMSLKHGGPLCMVREKYPALNSLIEPALIARLNATHDAHFTADIGDGLFVEVWFHKVGITL